MGLTKVKDDPWKGQWAYIGLLAAGTYGIASALVMGRAGVVGLPGIAMSTVLGAAGLDVLSRTLDPKGRWYEKALLALALLALGFEMGA